MATVLRSGSRTVVMFGSFINIVSQPEMPQAAAPPLLYQLV
jgi:hypothetical protein